MFVKIRVKNQSTSQLSTQKDVFLVLVVRYYGEKIWLLPGKEKPSNSCQPLRELRTD
jgi:hypothetical protein